MEYSQVKTEYGQQAKKLQADLKYLDMLIQLEEGLLATVSDYPHTAVKTRQKAIINASLTEKRLKRSELLSGKPWQEFRIFI